MARHFVVTEVKKEGVHVLGRAVVHLVVLGKHHREAWTPYLYIEVSKTDHGSELSWVLFTERTFSASSYVSVVKGATPLPEKVSKMVRENIREVLTSEGFVFDFTSKSYVYDKPVGEKEDLEDVVSAVFAWLDAFYRYDLNIREEISDWEGELEVLVEITSVMLEGDGKYHGSARTNVDLVRLMRDVGLNEFKGKVDKVFNRWMVIVSLLPEGKGEILFDAFRRLQEMGGEVHVDVVTAR